MNDSIFLNFWRPLDATPTIELYYIHNIGVIFMDFYLVNLQHRFLPQSGRHECLQALLVEGALVQKKIFDVFLHRLRTIRHNATQNDGALAIVSYACRTNERNFAMVFFLCVCVKETLGKYGGARLSCMDT